MRVLIVEDDAFIAELLSDGLADDGYECDVASSAAQGEELARLFPYGVLILDVMLPEGAEAGFGLGQRLRQYGLPTPILYLTARGTVGDRIRGLDIGDDYLGKPFDFGELRARLRALLRRASGHPRNTVALQEGWMLDLSGREVLKGELRAELTRREFLLLELLVLHPGRVFGRDEIIERLWGGEGGVEPKVIDVYVSTLRRKTHESLIETVRGSGYRLGRGPDA
ncbi:response regulator transcription factor [Deinococcus sp.]|uniref:response regulator transcription factor n=1 Tax=Deinococcus sp. TaxID=47478 RepID=UPI003CC5991D